MQYYLQKYRNVEEGAEGDGGDDERIINYEWPNFDAAFLHSDRRRYIVEEKLQRLKVASEKFYY